MNDEGKQTDVSTAVKGEMNARKQDETNPFAGRPKSLREKCKKLHSISPPFEMWERRIF